MKLALVHDFLVQHGGAEEVLKVFHDVWPEAPIYTLVHDPKRIGSLFSGADIRSSFIQRLPFGKRRYQWFLPLMPTAIERHDLTGYDVVLSSSSAFAKGAITSPETLHLCYCHTPTRYLWTDTHRYLHDRGTLPPMRSLIHPLLSLMRLWDRQAADRADHFIANSKNVQSRIQKYYRRDSYVIHPPVDTSRFTINNEKREVELPGGSSTSASQTVELRQVQSNRNYFLAGGRLVAYKRFDLIVRVFNRLGIPLKIFGTGPAFAALRKEAKPNIEFLGFVDASERAELYRNCTAFIHPQEEDFGLTVIEAMASGRPVIAYAKGGALETIKEGETGILFHEQIWEALADAVLRFNASQFDSQKIRAHAMQWDVEQFKTKIKQYVDEKWKTFQQQRGS